MKVCSKCKIEKDESGFYKDKGKKDGLRSTCKKCCEEPNKRYYKNNIEKVKESSRKWRENNPEKRRESKRRYRENNVEKIKEDGKKYRQNNREKIKGMHLKYFYNLTLEEYNDMLLQQNNRCKICGKEFNNTNKSDSVCVDHCHKTKKVRGLLCDKCNKGIGSFEDDANVLRNAINYLNNSIVCDYEI